MLQRRFAAALVATAVAACAAENTERTRAGDPAGGAGALGLAGRPAGPSGGSSGPVQMRGAPGGPGSSDDLGSEDAGSGCAQAEYEATLRPLDMLVLLDQSGSMTEDDDRWTPTTSAIKRFVTASESAGMGIGLQYFPLGQDEDAKCEGSTYAEPSVAIAALPGNAQPMIESIDAHYFTQEDCCDSPEHEGTPTRPAIEGVFDYLRGWLARHPERDAVVLLATDGEPSSVCDDNEIEDVSRVIQAAAQASPSVKTYVIGIGEEEELAELAEAGGTGHGPFVVDGTGARTEVQLLETLATIRGESLGCDFEVPTGMNSDPTNINVRRSGATGSASTLVKVPAQADCSRATQGGWYFDVQNQRIHLCPDTCQRILAQPSAQVDIVVGCAAVLL